MKVQQAADSGEIACATTSADGCQTIHNDVDRLQAECRTLKQQLQEAQSNVQQALDRLTDLGKKLDMMATWTKETELWLHAQKDTSGDVTDRNLQLQKVKVTIHTRLRDVMILLVKCVEVF